MGLINTVLGYKKGSKTKNIFSMSENMMFELSNALSIVFISLKLVKIRQVKVLSVAPPKGHESLPVEKTFTISDISMHFTKYFMKVRSHAP